MYAKFFKRFLDFWLSLLALLALSPLLLSAALTVRINLGSQMFFKQKRPGKKEEILCLIKFHTILDATVWRDNQLTGEEIPKLIEEKGTAALSSDAESLTAPGRFLRTLSFDEFPELVNILKSTMSIVGSRPSATIYLPYYIGEERHRHDAMSGLIGLAQVSGRNAIFWKKCLPTI